jgi:hypothetical protein
MMSRDQRSPKRSSERLTGQPDRRLDFELDPTQRKVTEITCESQVNLYEDFTVVEKELLIAKGAKVAKKSWNRRGAEMR